MSDDRELLYFKMQLLQAEIEMNAMIAENKYRMMVDNQLSYGEKDFMGLIEKYGIHNNKFPSYKG